MYSTVQYIFKIQFYYITYLGAVVYSQALLALLDVFLTGTLDTEEQRLAYRAASYIHYSHTCNDGAYIGHIMHTS